jgi:isopentenyl-diphosphate Delta-isomerase
MNRIALVNDVDELIGFGEKLGVHKSGILHRAFSIVVFNSNNEILIQRRALEKYHSPGLWTNTCCSHLAEGEIWPDVLHQRLLFEMGFDCKLEFADKFQYRAEFTNGLIENEIDHVYTGVWSGNPKPNPYEVCDYKWIDPDILIKDLKQIPHNYTVWFPEVLKVLKLI